MRCEPGKESCVSPLPNQLAKFKTKFEKPDSGYTLLKLRNCENYGLEFKKTILVRIEKLR